MATTIYPALWLDRICARIGISYLAGVIFMGVLPLTFGTILELYWLGDLTSSSPLLAVNTASLIAFVPVPFVSLIGARYAVRRVTDLNEYARTLGSGKDFERHRQRLGSLKFPAILTAALGGIAVPLVWTGEGSRLPPSELGSTLLIYLYALLTITTLVWTYSYSMYVVHHLGSQQMTLLSFAADRTLGLGPFGATAFQLALVYLGASIILVVHLNIPPLPIQSNLALLALFFVAIPLFFLPLRTIHRQLVSAKSREHAWIAQRYVETLAAIKATGDAPLSAEIKSDLATVRQLAEDVARVQSWPFDTSVLARLVAIIISVSAILIGAYIRDLLKF